MQHQRLRQEASIAIIRAPLRLKIEMTEDQSPIVMERTAEFDLQMQAVPGSAALRKDPAASGVKQVSFMDQRPIHPKPHAFGPPAHHQSGQA